MPRAVLLLLVLLGGCLARDIVDVTTWEQRGERVGEEAYVYCNRAAPRERTIFQWGLERTIGPHRIIIICEPPR